MRMDELFDDLAAQAGAVSDRILWDEAQEMSRAETATLALLDRLVPGARVHLWLTGSHVLDAQVIRVGRDALVASAAGQEWLIPGGSILRTSSGGHSRGRQRESVRFSGLLRGLSRDRSQVGIMLDNEQAIHGRLLGCGSDHCEMSVLGHARTLVNLEHIAAVVRRPNPSDSA
jgi:hypothetical protein